jgi:3-hydroxy-9,10-secoandrosta-1,3,5(10)-triene-9,17-dione monooxygenase
MSDTTTAPGSAAVPPPEPDVTPAEMIARAEALIPMLREQQDDAEQRGYYGEEVHREFLRAGFSRMLQPRRYGGYELDLPAFLRTMTKIATGDPGTGWCLTLSSSHALVVGTYFPEEVQAEAFGPDGDFRCPHPVGPLGEAVRVEGGFRVSGKATYASGIPYATWALCNALVPSPNDGEPPTVIVMLVPRRDLTMLDDWGSVNGSLLGMLSSGSNSFVLEDVFVPDGFWQPFDWMGERTEITPGFALHGNPLYLTRVAGPYHATLVLNVVGAARAALDEFRRLIMDKPTTFPPIVPRYRFHDDQRAYGMATAMTDAAETIVYGFGDQYMEALHRAAAGENTMNPEQDARWWAMLQQAGGLAAGAVETLAHRSTSSATGKGTKLGRYLRDVTMYRQHISSQQLDHAVRNAAFYLGASDDWLGGPPRGIRN